ncbi:Serine/threonine-protein kinase zyg-8 [Toxocara canis]|uniref:Serine/threonine-protein kinase zyg-8 n=1 Tax=Toxocara canis TaxID=6265 RepID=A0A0B2VX72_TOXCA|nr:Serine/threonine-protein kinase zyg-8 [Toxocara canis]
MMEAAGALTGVAKSTKKKVVQNSTNLSSGESKPTTASSASKRASMPSSSLAGKRIRIYRNGDIFFKGLKVVINTRQINSVQAFLDVINERIGLTHGAKRLYTVSGQHVKTMDEIENDKEYVAATNVFTPLNYGQLKVPFTCNETSKFHSEAPSKHPLRISRSNEPRKERAQANTKRAGSLAPPVKHAAINAQPNGNPTTATKKKLVKRKVMQKEEATKLERSPQEACSENSVSAQTNSLKQKKKVLKKKVKIPEETRKYFSPPPDSSSPASTITRAQSIIEHISINERTPTPLPVREELDCEEDDRKSDSIPSSAVGSSKRDLEVRDHSEEERKVSSEQSSEETKGDFHSGDENSEKAEEQLQANDENGVVCTKQASTESKERSPRSEMNEKYPVGGQ